MGGYGSGRSGWRPKAEDLKSISIFYLHRKGLLSPDRSFTLTWSNRGRETGKIKVKTYPDKVILDYKTRQCKEDAWLDVEEDVFLDWTPCNYGGKRPWFKCPSCNKRIGVLFLSYPLFLCRHCLNVTYRSSNETDVDRLRSKAIKIRDRLGASGALTESVWNKPKGMHWKTFERLAGKANRDMEKSFELAYEQFGFKF